VRVGAMQGTQLRCERLDCGDVDRVGREAPLQASDLQRCLPRGDTSAVVGRQNRIGSGWTRTVFGSSSPPLFGSLRQKPVAPRTVAKPKPLFPSSPIQTSPQTPETTKPGSEICRGACRRRLTGRLGGRGTSAAVRVSSTPLSPPTCEATVDKCLHKLAIGGRKRVAMQRLDRDPAKLGDLERARAQGIGPPAPVEP